MRRLLMVSVWLCALALTVAAQEGELKVPAEVAPFVEAGAKAIAIERGDLNGDGRADFILVLERENPARDENGFPSNQRPLLVLVRGADGRLSLAGRNDRLVMCSECGGVFGDPFEGVTAGRNTFTVDFYGGSAWRWKYSYRFNYSRRDRTWQLVRVEDLSYHTSNPDKVKTLIFTPPRDFGKIGLADFDPANYLKKSARRRAER